MLPPQGRVPIQRSLSRRVLPLISIRWGVLSKVIRWLWNTPSQRSAQYRPMAWEISAGLRAPGDQYMEPEVSTTLMALAEPISPGR